MFNINLLLCNNIASILVSPKHCLNPLKPILILNTHANSVVWKKFLRVPLGCKSSTTATQNILLSNVPTFVEDNLTYCKMITQLHTSSIITCKYKGKNKCLWFTSKRIDLMIQYRDGCGRSNHTQIKFIAETYTASIRPSIFRLYFGSRIISIVYW